MSMAAKAIGSEELEKKFNDALECLERHNSVAFAASLVSRPPPWLDMRCVCGIQADPFDSLLAVPLMHFCLRCDLYIFGPPSLSSVVVVFGRPLVSQFDLQLPARYRCLLSTCLVQASLGCVSTSARWRRLEVFGGTSPRSLQGQGAGIVPATVGRGARQANDSTRMCASYLACATERAFGGAGSAARFRPRSAAALTSSCDTSAATYVGVHGPERPATPLRPGSKKDAEQREPLLISSSSLVSPRPLDESPAALRNFVHLSKLRLSHHPAIPFR